MFDLLREMSEWLAGFADSTWAVPALVAASFTESIFLPIPPDLLLIGIAISRPQDAIWLAALVTISSVAGALVGHWLGLRIGRPLLAKMFSASKIEPVERMFKRFGMWAVLLAAITPLPYKLFAILAGVLRLDRRVFVAASLVGRGARFLSIGILISLYGEEIEGFIADNFEVITVAMVASVGAAIVAVVVVNRRRRSKSAAP